MDIVKEKKEGDYFYNSFYENTRTFWKLPIMAD